MQEEGEEGCVEGREKGGEEGGGGGRRELGEGLLA